MTRKHFEIVAKAMRDSNASDETIKELCKQFAQVNPRFNSETFIKACKG